METKRKLAVKEKSYSSFSSLSCEEIEEEWKGQEYAQFNFKSFESHFHSTVRSPQATPAECLKAQIGDFAEAYRFISKHYKLPHEFINFLGSKDEVDGERDATTFYHNIDMDTLGDLPTEKGEEIEYRTKEGFPEKSLLYHLMIDKTNLHFILFGARKVHVRWLIEHGGGKWNVEMSEENYETLSTMDLKEAESAGIKINEDCDEKTEYEAVIVCFEACETLDDVREIFYGVPNYKEFYLVDWEIDRFNPKSLFKTYSVEKEDNSDVHIVLAHYEDGLALGGQYWPAYSIEELAREKKAMNVSRFMKSEDDICNSFRTFRFYYPNVMAREDQVVYLVSDSSIYTPHDVEFEIMELVENKRLVFSEPKNVAKYGEVEDPVYVAGYNAHSVPFVVKEGIFYWLDRDEKLCSGEYRPMMDAEWESGYCRFGDYDPVKKKYDWIKICDLYGHELGYHERRDYCQIAYPLTRWVPMMTFDDCKMDKVGSGNGCILSGRGQFDAKKLLWNRDSTYEIPPYYEIKGGPLGCVTGHNGLEVIKGVCAKEFLMRIMSGRRRLDHLDFKPGFKNYEEVMKWSRSYPNVIKEGMRLDKLLAHYRIRHGIAGLADNRNQKDENARVWLRKDFIKLFEWDEDNIRGKTRVKLVVDRKKGEG